VTTGRIRRSGTPTQLAHWRLHRGFSQQELAERSGVPLGTLRRIEQAQQQRPPDLRHLQNLRVALGCHLDDLLEDRWRGWSDLPRGPKQPPPPEENWKPSSSSTLSSPEPWWTRGGSASIKPATPVASLQRNFTEAELTRTFDLDLVSALVGMQPAYIRRALGGKPRGVSLARVLALLELDAYGETFVPRSRIPNYLLRSEHMTGARSDSLVIDRPVALFAGDARDLIRRLPASSVQCVVTSGPYWATRLYGAHIAVAWADGETAPYGHEQTPEGFIRHTIELLFLLKPAVAPRGSVWWNLMDTYNTRTPIRGNAAETLNAMGGNDQRDWGDHGARRYSSGHSYLKDGEQASIPARVAERASRSDYWAKGTITWRKTASMPETAARVTRALEYIIHLSVARAPLFRKDAYHNIPVDSEGVMTATSRRRSRTSGRCPPRPATAATAPSSRSRCPGAASV
jgi:transcriptional regulator with XRE-family HTH domain